MKQVDLAKLEKMSDYRLARPLLDSIMAILAGVLLLQQASWRVDKSSDDAKKAAQVDTSEDLMLQDLEAAQLWIQGGHSDLDRYLYALEGYSGKSVQSAAMSNGLVYGQRSSL
jgi:hypothetical protein